MIYLKLKTPVDAILTSHKVLKKLVVSGYLAKYDSPKDVDIKHNPKHKAYIVEYIIKDGNFVVV